MTTRSFRARWGACARVGDMRSSRLALTQKCRIALRPCRGGRISLSVTIGCAMATTASSPSSGCSRYNEHIPAVLITGDTAADRLREAQESGLILLHKPVAEIKLRATVGNLMRAHAS